MALIVEGLKYLELNINDQSNEAKYGLTKSPKLRKLFLDYLFNYLLLPYEHNPAKPKPPQQPPVQPQQSNEDGSPDAETIADVDQTTLVNEAANAEANSKSNLMACLSETIYKQLKQDVNLEDVEELEQVNFKRLFGFCFSLISHFLICLLIYFNRIKPVLSNFYH